MSADKWETPAEMAERLNPGGSTPYSTSPGWSGSLRGIRADREAVADRLAAVMVGTVAQVRDALVALLADLRGEP